MAAVIEIPGALREFAGGRYEVRLDGTPGTVAEALTQLWAAHPGLRDRVMDERGAVRTHINIFVDGENTRFTGGLATPLGDGAELIILPAVSGGTARVTAPVRNPRRTCRAAIPAAGR